MNVWEDEPNTITPLRKYKWIMVQMHDRERHELTVTPQSPLPLCSVVCSALAFEGFRIVRAVTPDNH